MYKIRIFTDFGEFYLPTSLSELPNDEFIKCFDARKDTYYINRNQIKFYKIDKEQWKN